MGRVNESLKFRPLLSGERTILATYSEKPSSFNEKKSVQLTSKHSTEDVYFRRISCSKTWRGFSDPPMQTLWVFHFRWDRELIHHWKPHSQENHFPLKVLHLQNFHLHHSELALNLVTATGMCAPVNICIKPPTLSSSATKTQDLTSDGVNIIFKHFGWPMLLSLHRHPALNYFL